MSQPAVVITELDGALGILPTTAGRLYAVVGVSSIGPVDTPATFARVSDVVANFGDGPLVEAAAYYIEKYGRPVVVVRTGQTNPGTFPAGAAVVFVGTGTSVITVDNVGTAPHDDYEFYFEVVAGGTIGVDGITFRWSLDNGRTLSPVTALGVAASFVFPASGGAQIDFAAGTLVAGDVATFRGDAPKWNTTEIAAALDALFASSVSWENAHVVGNIEGADFDVIDPKFTGAQASGKYRGWMGNTRMPDLAETEAAYLAAMALIFDSKATVHGEICSGAAKTISSVTARQYRRPVAFSVAAFEQSVSEEINIADVNLGPVPGVSIRDANGNPDEHDESLNPGLDDARFTVLRTWEGVQGVYVNRPRILSAAGSDFDLFTKRRVLNITHDALRLYFIRRLNKPVLVDATSGFILESEALEIESGARAAMRSRLLAKPKASGIEFVLSRTDNILSTKTLTGSGRVIPLAYPEQIELEVGFLNPALTVQTV
jgi:hypothetical protein